MSNESDGDPLEQLRQEQAAEGGSRLDATTTASGPSNETEEATADDSGGNENEGRSFADILDAELDADDDPHLSTWSPKYAPLLRALDEDDPAAVAVRDQLRAFLADEMDRDVEEIGDSRSELIAEAIRYLLTQADEDGRSNALQELREARAREAMRDV